MRRGSDQSPKRRGSSPWKPRGDSPNKRNTWKRNDPSPIGRKTVVTKDPLFVRRGTD
jgi:hypothetical protein